MAKRGGGGDSGMINDIICNGHMEHDGEEEAQMHNDNPILWMRHACGQPLKCVSTGLLLPLPLARMHNQLRFVPRNKRKLKRDVPYFRLR